jgi:hypothetical protein
MRKLYHLYACRMKKLVSVIPVVIDYMTNNNHQEFEAPICGTVLHIVESFR